MSAVRHYVVPLFLALVIHGAAAGALLVGWNPDTETTRVIKPRIINSTLVMLKAKAKPVRTAPPPDLARKATKQAADAAAKAAAAKQARDKAAADKTAAEKAAKKQAELDAQTAREAEAARQRAAEQEKLARLAQLANASFEDLLEDEAENLAADADAVAAQSYRYRISEQVKRNWSRPPSARLGMRVKLLIELVPTGAVVSVTIAESSGSPEFDRSAEQAVRKVRRFEVPKEASLFEKHFRKFYFLFEPTDLLR